MELCPSPTLEAPSFSLADASLAAFLAGPAAAAPSSLPGREMEEEPVSARAQMQHSSKHGRHRAATPGQQRSPQLLGGNRVLAVVALTAVACRVVAVPATPLQHLQQAGPHCSGLGRRHRDAQRPPEVRVEGKDGGRRMVSDAVPVVA